MTREHSAVRRNNIGALLAVILAVLVVGYMLVVIAGALLLWAS